MIYGYLIRDLHAFIINAGLTGPALFLVWLIGRLLPKHLARRNFRGDTVYLGGPAVVAVYCIVEYLASKDTFIGKLGLQPRNLAYGFLYATLGFGLLGLVDDVFGSRNVGGFRGHFEQLFKHGKVTTGIVKVLGGAIVGFNSGLCVTIWIFFTIHQGIYRPFPDPLVGLATGLLYGIFIAFSANTFNLLDVRPGRCIAISIVLLTGIFVATCVEVRHSTTLLVAIQLGCLAVVYYFDRSGKMMLGDCGSNAIGAALAVCWINVLQRWEVAVLAAFLAAFQIWCEKHSLSGFIESKPLLRALDRKIGVR